MGLRIERYKVYQVNLDPVRGSEMAKSRPAVVVSDNLMNTHLNTVVICPITSRIHPTWPSRVQTVLDNHPAEIAVDQIRTVDKMRLHDYSGAVDPEVAASIRHLITQMYGVLSVSADEA